MLFSSDSSAFSVSPKPMYTTPVSNPKSSFLSASKRRKFCRISQSLSGSYPKVAYVQPSSALIFVDSDMERASWNSAIASGYIFFSR